MNFVVRFLASFGFTGYFPIAPATFASGIFAGIYYFIPGGHWVVNPWVCLATLIISIPVASQMEKIVGREDPGVIVLDEVVGMQVILVGAADVSFWGIVVAFFVFRIFDIAKPWPVGRSQSLPGGYGVVIDDFLAGIYSRAAIIALSLFFPSIGSFGFAG